LSLLNWDDGDRSRLLQHRCSGGCVWL